MQWGTKRQLIASKAKKRKLNLVSHFYYCFIAVLYKCSNISHALAHAHTHRIRKVARRNAIELRSTESVLQLRRHFVPGVVVMRRRTSELDSPWRRSRGATEGYHHQAAGSNLSELNESLSAGTCIPSIRFSCSLVAQNHRVSKGKNGR